MESHPPTTPHHTADSHASASSAARVPYGVRSEVSFSHLPFLSHYHRRRHPHRDRPSDGPHDRARLARRRTTACSTSGRAEDEAKSQHDPVQLFPLQDES
ncbi:hypothetical protein VF21_09582 [Pseudogymnoascus sp. 05NY08]|nr:hypothetical protein VF21_09582 [Pseudogymnoascus sp. 05NY08]